VFAFAKRFRARPVALSGIPLAVILSAVLAACSGSSNDGSLPAVQIKTVTNRADLVSDGDALVQLVTPDGSARGLKVALNGADITSAFSVQPDGRIIGLVTGMTVGTNTINANASAASSGQLTIVNAPRGGPVLLSAQAGPWVCATPKPTVGSGNTPSTNASGLSTNAVDAQCNIATEYKLFYRTTKAVSINNGVDGGCLFVLPDPSPTTTNANPGTPANSCFQPYVAGTTPSASVASTTTAGGVTMPYIVRVERGTLNRGIYDIAVLFDPNAPNWTATTPQKQWNRKVVYSYGASTGQPRLQFRTEQNWADDTALSKGFMVVDNSITDSLYNSNRVLAAETTIMMKEYIGDHYGEIFYVMGNGCSGGSIGQNTVSSIYPGVLDGIQPSCDYPDSVTTGIEVSDCVLLSNFYATPAWSGLQTGLTQAQINAKKTAINGHVDQTACHGWYNLFGSNNYPGNYTPLGVVDTVGTIGPIGLPKNNCLLPASQVYDPVTNPTGTRCGDPDLAAAVWGTTVNALAPSGKRALTTNDNVGVQYGLKALLAGKISAEEFVTLNEKIGGTNTDNVFTAARSVADAGALTIAYTAGIVASGINLGQVAIIDARGYDEVYGDLAAGQYGIHQYWRSYSERARLLNEAGSHANQVIWRTGYALTPVGPQQTAAITTASFQTMDTWLTNLMTAAPKTGINSPHTQAQVVAAKPAAAVDLCYLSTDLTFSNKITDPKVCDADPRLVPKASPRQVAGGPVAENILKCQLKPIAQSDYSPVVFTAAQLARLQAVFAGGVCDFSKPGVGQVSPTAPMTFKAGPGGAPLGASPVSGNS